MYLGDDFSVQLLLCDMLPTPKTKQSKTPVQMTNKLQNKKNLIILCLRTMDMNITNYTTD